MLTLRTSQQILYEFTKRLFLSSHGRSLAFSQFCIALGAVLWYLQPRHGDGHIIHKTHQAPSMIQVTNLDGILSLAFFSI